MATFPVLRTGAASQCPLGRSVRFQTQSVRFLDGTSQRYPLYGAGLRRWTVKLDLLDDRELAAVVDFVETQVSEVFSFVDPVTNEIVRKCVLAGETFDSTITRELSGQASLVIEEIV